MSTSFDTLPAVSLSANASSCAPAAPFVRFMKLEGGLRDGVEVCEVHNGRLRLWLLPQRGMGIWKAWLDGFEIGWQAPIRGPVNPRFVPLAEPDGLGWLDGFDELLCRCGLESNGAPEFDARGILRYPLHGRIANLPARCVDAQIDAQTGEIAVSAEVDESRLHAQKLRLQSTTSSAAHSNTIRVRDRITNLSARQGSGQMLYHINFGAPLLDAGSRIHAPVRTLVPRTSHAAASVEQWDSIEAPDAQFQEQVYFLDLLADEQGQTQVLLHNASAERGVSLHFSRSQLPCFTLWKNTAAMADGYVVGLEPGINFPNPRSFEARHGRVAALDAGQSRELALDIEIHGSAASVAQAAAAIARLQATVTPTLHAAPLSGWSAEASRQD
ncbi:aldose 1-epimerase family protein [Noviherbaspirillum sedimenti]|uniref:DUF4432 family protein n=1 Tax=Noviherbaspirillum sedimenti TaxID=2320865 RepID=A0A3A3G033_9BURK|nr:aldose 1-epimerase family protein [Noviherbaspirillum sedimenti]RJG01797.1 DUF4432 family protein [Noviherbaspirillum sedimenti]